MNYELGSGVWGDGEMGRWGVGSGEMGENK